MDVFISRFIRSPPDGERSGMATVRPPRRAGAVYPPGTRRQTFGRPAGCLTAAHVATSTWRGGPAGTGVGVLGFGRPPERGCQPAGVLERPFWAISRVERLLPYGSCRRRRRATITGGCGSSTLSRSGGEACHWRAAPLGPAAGGAGSGHPSAQGLHARAAEVLESGASA